VYFYYFNVFVRVFLLFYTPIVQLAYKVFIHLARVDVSAGNSFYNAVLRSHVCHY